MDAMWMRGWQRSRICPMMGRGPSGSSCRTRKGRPTITGSPASFSTACRMLLRYTGTSRAQAPIQASPEIRSAQPQHIKFPQANQHTEEGGEQLAQHGAPGGCQSRR